MKTTRIAASFFCLSLASWTQNVRGQTSVTAADKTTEVVVAAAQTFLGTLNQEQQKKVQFDFNDEAQRKRWSNLPNVMFKRSGLRAGDLTKAQHEALLGLLAKALSAQGYEKVLGIMEGDEVLKKSEGQTMFGKGEYFVSFCGEPSVKQPWMIQFGGHHLALNITYVGNQSTIAPSHTGVQPAIFEMEGKTVRPLGRETDRAFDLVNSLDEAQRKKAVLGFQMHDLVLGPGRDGQTIQPEGVKGSDLTQKQREMLLDLAGEWTGIMSEPIAMAKMNELREHVGDTWFAWSGPTQKGSAAYFRVQGPTVIIEYAPQKLGADPTKHIHTIFRDPTNDYGAKWRAQKS